MRKKKTGAAPEKKQPTLAQATRMLVAAAKREVAKAKKACKTALTTRKKKRG